MRVARRFLGRSVLVTELITGLVECLLGQSMGHRLQTEEECRTPSTLML